MEKPLRKKRIVLTVNGHDREVEVDSRCTLAEVLREELGLTGTKVGCNRAECGTCTVLVDGKAVYSCTMLAVEAEGRRVETIEGLERNGVLHPVQEAFIEHDALQCGYCTPGMVMVVKALLDENLNPSEQNVKEAIAGNYCRCGAQPDIVQAALTAAHWLREGRG